MLSLNSLKMHKISIKFCVFYTHIEFFEKNLWGHTVLAFFVNFEVERGRNGSQKQKNVCYKWVLELNFAPINSLG
jgi:hypothetical protein